MVRTELGFLLDLLFDHGDDLPKDVRIIIKDRIKEIERPAQPQINLPSIQRIPMATQVQEEIAQLVANAPPPAIDNVRVDAPQSPSTMRNLTQPSKPPQQRIIGGEIHAGRNLKGPRKF